MLNCATTLATAAYRLLPQSPQTEDLLVRQTLKHTQIRAGFANEADILLHATSPSEASPTLADITNVFCLCLIWKLLHTELGNKLMYAKFAGAASNRKCSI